MKNGKKNGKEHKRRVGDAQRRMRAALVRQYNARLRRLSPKAKAKEEALLKRARTEWLDQP